MNSNEVLKTINGYDIIMESICGSHLYGTNTAESDTDYVGIVLPKDSEVFGFKVMEELDVSLKSKLDSGKNSKEAVDRKFYEFRNFVKLAAANNPNIIELLFVNPGSLLIGSQIHTAMVDNAYAFVDHNKIHTKFLAYAGSQKHKMILKPDNYTALQVSLDFLYGYIGTDSLADLSDSNHIRKSKQLLVELGDVVMELKLPIEFKDSFVKVGDLNFNKSITVKSAISKIEERIKKAGSRTDLFLKHGFDTKFGSHCVRLLLEALSLLKESSITFPLKEAPFIKDIKCGKYTREQTLVIIEGLEKQVDDAYKGLSCKKMCDLPVIEQFVVDTLKTYFYK